METYIVDASVGTKWFFKEESSAVAENLIRQVEAREIRAVVPDLFYAELANIFWKRFQRRQIKATAGLNAFDVLMGFKLERYSDYELSDVALENAVQLGISAYDAVYVSLAEIYAAPLVTADHALIKACKNKFDFILPLSEFGK